MYSWLLYCKASQQGLNSPTDIRKVMIMLSATPFIGFITQFSLSGSQSISPVSSSMISCDEHSQILKKFSNNLTNLNVLNRTVKLKALEDDEECLEIQKRLTVRSNLEVTCENPITKMMKTVKKRARSWVSILSRNVSFEKDDICP